jgi:hypothetical protein
VHYDGHNPDVSITERSASTDSVTWARDDKSQDGLLVLEPLPLNILRHLPMALRWPDRAPYPPQCSPVLHRRDQHRGFKFPLMGVQHSECCRIPCSRVQLENRSQGRKRLALLDAALMLLDFGGALLSKFTASRVTGNPV